MRLWLRVDSSNPDSTGKINIMSNHWLIYFYLIEVLTLNNIFNFRYIGDVIRGRSTI